MESKRGSQLKYMVSQNTFRLKMTYAYVQLSEVRATDRMDQRTTLRPAAPAGASARCPPRFSSRPVLSFDFVRTDGRTKVELSNSRMSIIRDNTRNRLFELFFLSVTVGTCSCDLQVEYVKYHRYPLTSSFTF